MYICVSTSHKITTSHTVVRVRSSWNNLITVAFCGRVHYSNNLEKLTDSEPFNPVASEAPNRFYRVQRNRKWHCLAHEIRADDNRWLYIRRLLWLIQPPELTALPAVCRSLKELLDSLHSRKCNTHKFDSWHCANDCLLVISCRPTSF